LDYPDWMDYLSQPERFEFLISGIKKERGDPNFLVSGVGRFCLEHPDQLESWVGRAQTAIIIKLVLEISGSGLANHAYLFDDPAPWLFYLLQNDAGRIVDSATQAMDTADTKYLVEQVGWTKHLKRTDVVKVEKNLVHNNPAAVVKGMGRLASSLKSGELAEILEAGLSDDDPEVVQRTANAIIERLGELTLYLDKPDHTRITRIAAPLARPDSEVIYKDPAWLPPVLAVDRASAIYILQSAAAKVDLLTILLAAPKLAPLDETPEFAAIVRSKVAEAHSGYMTEHFSELKRYYAGRKFELTKVANAAVAAALEYDRKGGIVKFSLDVLPYLDKSTALALIERLRGKGEMISELLSAREVWAPLFEPEEVDSIVERLERNLAPRRQRSQKNHRYLPKVPDASPNGGSTGKLDRNVGGVSMKGYSNDIEVRGRGITTANQDLSERFDDADLPGLTFTVIAFKRNPR
jgi:hypothetical protein